MPASDPVDWGLLIAVGSLVTVPPLVYAGRQLRQLLRLSSLEAIESKHMVNSAEAEVVIPLVLRLVRTWLSGSSLGSVRSRMSLDFVTQAERDFQHHLDSVDAISDVRELAHGYTRAARLGSLQSWRRAAILAEVVSLILLAATGAYVTYRASLTPDSEWPPLRWLAGPAVGLGAASAVAFLSGTACRTIFGSKIEAIGEWAERS